MKIKLLIKLVFVILGLFSPISGNSQNSFNSWHLATTNEISLTTNVQRILAPRVEILFGLNFEEIKLRLKKAPNRRFIID